MRAAFFEACGVRLRSRTLRTGRGLAMAVVTRRERVVPGPSEDELRRGSELNLPSRPFRRKP